MSQIDIDVIDLAELGKGVFEGSPDCIKLLDADGHILAMNRNGICAMEIDDFKSVRGAMWPTLWTEENRHAIEAAIVAARSGRNYSLNLACPTAKGSPRWWDVTVSPIISADGRVNRILSVSRDITEARFAMEKVRVSEARFRSLVTATAAIVWGMPGSGQFDEEQPGWSSFTGQLFEAMKGLGWLDAVHPDDRQETAVLWDQAVSTGGLFEGEHRLRRADGQFRHMSMRAMPIKGHDNTIIEWIGVHTDIHDRKSGEAILRDNEERVRLATESAELGLWAWLPSTDEVVWENDRPYEIFGLDKREPAVTAREFLTRFVHPDHIAEFGHAVTNTIETGARLHFTGRIRRTNQELRWVEFFGNLQPDLDGDPLRIIGTVADITSGREREEELRRLAANLSEVDRRKTEFLAVLAHELRNPLAPIQHGLQLIRTQPGNADVLDKVRTMLDRQVNQMVRLVNDLLDVARITSGKVELRKRRAEISDLVQIAVETSMPLINSSNHSFSIKVPTESMPVYVDPERISQVISNLLNNAAKYTPSGGEISLDVSCHQHEVIISVTDNGIGIAPQSIGGVFDMFRQVGQDIERSQGGLGIGLSLVRQLVELHGGTTFATSPGEGGGSTFVIRLTMIDAPMATLLQTETLPVLIEPKKLRILVADDNIDAAEIFSMLLQVLGHDIEIAHNGHAAVKMIRELHPDIAFLDIGMPGLNGYEVANAIRNNAELADVTLVALTGWGSEQDKKQSTASGFDYHFIKPVDMKLIDKLLLQIIASH
ncbi:PAS domain-containing protein [Telluria aromaticivorans]|uniref:histidine kinase n=1 Tax=Telluria aromaticivorans TaxID=2725995 RepID=A0A7Y2NZL9_9BURK|nr:PAS domain-containing protein [Telluria aromaticivorans]NNG22631.1 PAS domain-containing protein [Telluria aromaticivorans]